MPLNSSSVPSLLVVGGATATGKSGLALALAQRLDAVVLSADSRQVYREFDIGTAKPSLADRQRVPHYLIDICPPTATLTLAEYQRQAQELIHQCHQTSRALPMLVGGTGLYIDAVVKGLKIPPVAPNAALRAQLQRLGQGQCYAMLRQLDRSAARRIHPNDRVRTIRALEVFYVSGQAMSSLQGEEPPPYRVLYLALDSDAEHLQRRIERRTQAMVEAGFAREVTHLVTTYGDDLPLLQTLGYAEMLRHLRGEIPLQTAQADIVKHTRQFAKRQRTWFRNRAAVHWFNADDPYLVDRVWAMVAAFMEVTTSQA